MAITQDSILLFIHAAFYRVGDEVYLDAQAQNGLRLWAENFSVVRVMAPLIETKAEHVPCDATDLRPFLEAHPTVETIMLPIRGTRRFLTDDLWSGRHIIAAQIARSQYLVFAVSGHLGDWGVVACLTAARIKRPYAVFKDVVDHQIARMLQQKQNTGRLKAIRLAAHNQLMKRSDHFVVRRAALSLLHGQDTMAYYAPISSNPHRVHNIHLSKFDRITAAALEARIARRDPKMLKIAYAGRVEINKGPEDWVEAIDRALQAGIDLRAAWYGTGPLLEERKADVAARNREDAIFFQGFVAHRQMLTKLKQADLFLFAHLTDESPRCLIEALTMGLPLVGYDSAYPRDLVGDSKAGLFVPRGDQAALARALTELAADPDRLAYMAREARHVAGPLNDEDVFRHRSDIIKTTL